MRKPENQERLRKWQGNPHQEIYDEGFRDGVAAAQACSAQAEMQAFSASDAACYHYPSSLGCDPACRVAFIAGAASIRPKSASEDTK
jgi:hypothetical protein